MDKIKSLKPVKKQTVTEMVIEQLIQLISIELKDGERLPPERQLMKLMSVGRSSLREALRALEIMGLIETRAGDGTFVARDKGLVFRKPLEWGVFSNEKSVKDLVEARALLEISIIEIVTERITDKELEAMEEVVKQMEQTGPPHLELFLRIDLRFHELLNRATKNDFLFEISKLSYRVLEKERSKSLDTEEEYQKSAQFHRDILERLKERNVGAAKAAMTAHMKWTELLFAKNFSPGNLKKK